MSALDAVWSVLDLAPTDWDAQLAADPEGLAHLEARHAADVAHQVAAVLPGLPPRRFFGCGARDLGCEWCQEGTPCGARSDFVEPCETQRRSARRVRRKIP